jgi:hypothetical protein
MPSFTDIANMSIGHLGETKSIQNLDDTSESSVSAKALRRFKEPALRSMLRMFPFGFAQARGVALPGEQATPDAEYPYSYQYPPDCIWFDRVSNGTPHRLPKIPHLISGDPTTKSLLIRTSIPGALGHWTFYHDDPAFWPEDFVVAYSFYWAHFAAPQITGGDKAGLGQRALSLFYEVYLPLAQAHDGNETIPEDEPRSDFELAR